MKNYAGMIDKDDDIAEELAKAGIGITRLPEILRGKTGTREVQTIIVGQIGPWVFERAWYYWIATGPGIPPVYADELHEAHGKVVRVDGHCACPSPKEWFKGFGVGHYHVDTQDGLNALADTIRRVMAEAL